MYSCSVDMWHPCPGCSVEVFRTQHLVMQQKHSTFSSDFSTSSPRMGTMRRPHTLHRQLRISSTRMRTISLRRRHDNGNVRWTKPVFAIFEL